MSSSTKLMLIFLFSLIGWGYSSKRIIEITVKNMVKVEGGSFEMGCSEFEVANWKEIDKDVVPMHEVYLSPFKINKYELSNIEYVQFLNSISQKLVLERDQNGFLSISYESKLIAKAQTRDFGYNSEIYINPSDNSTPKIPRLGSSKHKYKFNQFLISYNFGIQPGGEFFIQKDFEFFPVVNITWNGAVAYINWLNDELKMPPNKEFRLPTEAEWEYAAFGGHKSIEDNVEKLRYSEIKKPQSKAYKYVIKTIWRTGTGDPNEIGLYNIQDNVLEFCSDYYGRSHYSYSVNNNPKGPRNGNYRSIRGITKRITKRDKIEPNKMNFHTGFRLAQSL